MTLTERLDKFNLLYTENLSTAKISSIKAGGSAKLTVFPKNEDELLFSIKIANAYFEKYKIIGGCTNTFFIDDGFDGVIISTKKLNKLTLDSGNVTAEAGATLASLLAFGAAQNVDFGRGLFAIPGTVGGALRNNAGAFGFEIGDIFDFGYFYDVDSKKIIKLSADELSFSYRYSALQKENLIFLNGIFKGTTRDFKDIKSDFLETVKIRRSSHPHEPSLGSFFKRSDNVIPALLIDRAGLKGKTVGLASVSRKHAGFIINNGGATSSDVDALANEIEKTILEKFGVPLIREVELVK